MRFTPFAVAATLSAATYLAAPAMAADALGTPSATLTIKTKSADVGVGYTWGDARVTFHKKVYHYKVTGGEIAAVGFSELVSKGTVYNLHNIADMEGSFAVTSGEATLGEGLGGALLENKHGVRLKLESDAKGARLSAGAGGLTFERLK
ncbi:MAG: hypothetical protein ABF876_03670 [Acetobacter aceti]|uniref:DUF1134 domain-containing protein n=1 Tax=Acetobacter aceti TaxID=435 RepID=A0A1U9KKY0_ACEAC|nr:hypothetical protein [Acetobacter aceti]AQS86461.1 hypothetical protein A0U92_12040 [Acetobacter aceti]